MNSFNSSGENDHLRDEVLAAFVDGKLRGEERQRVVAHLDACPDCYEVFSETVRFVQDEEPGGAVVTFERDERRATWRRPLFWTAAAIAAVLLAVVIVPGLIPERVDPADETLLTTRLASALSDPGAAALAALEVRPPATRQALGMGPLPSPKAHSPFRVGIRLTDLRVALASGDKRAAERAVDDLEPVAPGLREAVDRMRWRGATRGAIADLERSYEGESAVRVAAGARAEAGWLAAGSGDAEFFSTDVGRAVYDALAQRLGDAVPGLDDLGALEMEFERWIEHP